MTICPKCGTNNVRKVTSIVSEGTSTSSVSTVRQITLGNNTYHVPVQLHATATSLLAQRLTPQIEEPKKMPPYSATTEVIFQYLLYLWTPFIFGIGLLAVLKLPKKHNKVKVPALLYTVFGFLTLLALSAVDEAGAVTPTETMQLAVVCFLPFFVIVLIYIYQITKVIKEELPVLEANALKSRQDNSAEIAAYHNAIRRWNELYYCLSDDVVFNPEDDSGAFVIPERMVNLLYRQEST